MSQHRPCDPPPRPMPPHVAKLRPVIEGMEKTMERMKATNNMELIGLELDVLRVYFEAMLHAWREDMKKIIDEKHKAPPSGD